jgi:spermidine/putrescine transport system ATP-binding protein
VEAHSGKVTLAIRPEQVRLAKADEAGTLPATVDSWVYFGTDTHCHLKLADGTEVVARLQSPATGDAALERGQRVGLRFTPGAAQFLGD